MDMSVNTDSYPELRQLSLDAAENTGIFIDRVYTVKAILGKHVSTNHKAVLEFTTII